MLKSASARSSGAKETGGEIPDSSSSGKMMFAKTFDISVMNTFDDYEAELLGMGVSSAVMAINHDWVIKSFPEGPKRTRDFKREKRIYEEIQPSPPFSLPYIPQYADCYGRGIILERLGITLRDRLKLGPVNERLRDRWMLEICEGVAFLHSKGVMHGDIGTHNILLDITGEHVKICDFAGSKIGNEDAWIQYQARNQHPKCIGKQPDARSEVFAIGSVLFELETSKEVFEGDTEILVQKKFAMGKFPHDTIPRRDVERVIGGCWKDKYVSVNDVCNELKKLSGLGGYKSTYFGPV